MEPQQDSTPERIGGFRVLRRLATGGTSDVLLARAEGPHGFGRAVVLKLLLAQYRDDESFERMFAREAAAYARLSHPAIVRLFDFFSDGGQLVMVLEFIDGLPLNKLRALLRGRGAELDDRAAFFVASRVFAALSAAHGARDAESGEFAPVIHRDVNPSNVLIPWDGHVKLADFGIAKVAGMKSDTQAGFIKGTYGYMAPEQVRGESVTPRADVYAATLLLWEMLTRRKAIQRGALPEMEVLRAMAEPQLPSLDVLRPDLPAAVREAVKRGLEPSADRRAIFADELVAVLRGAANLEEGRAMLVEALATVRPAHAGDDLEKTQETGPPRASVLSFPADTEIGMREIAPDTERAPVIAEEALAPIARLPRPAPPLPPRPAPIAKIALSQTLALQARPLAPPRSPPPPPPAHAARPQDRTMQGGFVPPSLYQAAPSPVTPPPPPPQPISSAPHFEMPSFPAPAEVSFAPPFAPPYAQPPSTPFNSPPPAPVHAAVPATFYAPTPAPSPVDAFANGAGATSPSDLKPLPLDVPRKRGGARWMLGGMVGLVVASIVLVSGLVFLRFRRDATRAAHPTPVAAAPPRPTLAAAAAASTSTTLTAPTPTPTTPTPTPTTPTPATTTPTSASVAVLPPSPVRAPPPAAPAPAAATPPFPSELASTGATTGDLDTSAARPQHRIWVDGRVVGQTPGVFAVPCGRRAVRLGSGGSLQTVEIPCGGQLKVVDR